MADEGKRGNNADEIVSEIYGLLHALEKANKSEEENIYNKSTNLANNGGMPVYELLADALYPTIAKELNAELGNRSLYLSVLFGKIGDAAVPALLPVIPKSEWAHHALGHIGSDKAIDILIKELQSSNWRRVEAAARGLGIAKNRKALPVLRQIYTDLPKIMPVGEVSIACKWAIDKIERFLEETYSEKLTYSERLLEQLNQLSPQALQKIDGKDLAPAASFAHSQGSGQIRAFQAAKLAKIGLASFAGQDLHVGFCLIFPAEGYDLPLFMSRWEETRQELNYYVDLLPTVDFLVDEAYRKKYIESIDPSWQRFVSMAGIRPEEDDRLRSISSIIYTAARCPVEREGLRLAALAVHSEYLKHYIAFVQEASQVSDTAKLAEIKRKTAAVRGMLRDYLQRFLTGPAGRVLGSAQTDYLIATCS